MRNTVSAWILGLFLIVSASPLAFSQRHSFDSGWDDKINVSFGAGASFPTDQAGQDLHTGWNLDASGGYNFNRYLSTNLDFGYQRWGLNDAALARFGEPGGRTTVWSLTLNPVLHLNPRGKVDPYVTSGFGVYHSNLSLTEPFNQTVFSCDPFFGFCFPQTATVNEVVASARTTKGGFNAGGGLNFRLGESHFKFFMEARYNRMFSSSGADLTYVPLTLGVRW